LQPADVPSGSQGAPYGPGPNDYATSAAFVKCIGVRDTGSDKVAEAHSEIFASGNFIIKSEASSYRSPSDLVTDMAALHSPKFSPCFEQMVNERLVAAAGPGSAIESSSFKLIPGSAGDPANVVAIGTSTIALQTNGQQVKIYQTAAFITGPLIEAEVDILSPDTPPPASLVNPLVVAVATRAARG
jgi:hypothetical protein